MPLKSAHEIAERVHDGVEENFPLVKHVTVHVNPYSEAEPPDTPAENVDGGAGDGNENETAEELEEVGQTGVNEEETEK